MFPGMGPALPLWATRSSHPRPICAQIPAEMKQAGCAHSSSCLQSCLLNWRAFCSRDDQRCWQAVGTFCCVGHQCCRGVLVAMRADVLSCAVHVLVTVGMACLSSHQWLTSQLWHRGGLHTRNLMVL